MEEQRRLLIGEYDFNEDYETVEFSHVMTTDYYRRGNPYKLFNKCGLSKVNMTFDLPESVKKPTCVCLTTTEGCWSGMMDIFLNERLKIEKLIGAGSNFQNREIILELDDDDTLQRVSNVITMTLREDAQFVYWLGDAKIEVTHIVPSTLVNITACAVVDMVNNRQIPNDSLDFLPNQVVAIIKEWNRIT